MEVELLTVFGEKLSEEESIMEIFLKIANASAELDLIVEPV
jgi:hypothetical protein